MGCAGAIEFCTMTEAQEVLGLLLEDAPQLVGDLFAQRGMPATQRRPLFEFRHRAYFLMSASTRTA